MARETAGAAISPQSYGRRIGVTGTPEGRISHDEAVDQLEGGPRRGALQRWRPTSRRSSIGTSSCATTVPYEAGSARGDRVVLAKGILCAWVLVLAVFHGSARAEMESRNATDSCSTLDRRMLLFGLSGPAECALGTGHHVFQQTQCASRVPVQVAGNTWAADVDRHGHLG